MDKGQLRLKLQKRLSDIEPEMGIEKSKQACRNLVSTQQFQNASVIMMYLAIPNETDCTEAILEAWQQGKTVVVPKISWENRHMIPVRINSLETDFSVEVSGLRNPINGTPVPFQEINLVITPALAFDRKGNRLGRGGSYYDRFFTNNELKAVRCGLAFAEQIIDSVPVASHDQPVDFLVTDNEIITFNDQQGE